MNRRKGNERAYGNSSERPAKYLEGQRKRRRTRRLDQQTGIFVGFGLLRGERTGGKVTGLIWEHPASRVEGEVS